MRRLNATVRTPASSSRVGVLSTLRQLLASRRPRLRVLRRRREPPAPPPATSTTPTVVERAEDVLRPAQSHTASPVHASTPATPAPPRGPDAEDGDESSSSDHASDAHDGTAPLKKPRKSKKKRSSSTWVAKLLNQTAPPKDRVHTRKKRHARTEAPTACHAVLRVATERHAALLGRVFAFLAPLEPGRTCVLVNRAVAVSVVKYYTRYCAWPRPRPYLAYQLLHLNAADGLARVLAMLPLADRVRASATSHAFRRAADALPLQWTRPEHATEFFRRVDASRVEARFQETTTLSCESVTWHDAVRLLRFMSDDDGEHFRAVQHITLARLDSVATERAFVDVVQSLFSDRISRTLRSLALADLGLEDAHYRELARLFYDSHFPQLETLDVSRSLFSSRFMRDWAKSFSEDRFRVLTSLDVTGVGMGVDDMNRVVACLRHVPRLRVLRLSHNFCSVGTMHAFARVLDDRGLVHLEALDCSAISVSDHGLRTLIDALGAAGACALRSLDISGNDVRAGDATMRSLADALARRSWPHLHTLNLSFTKPSHRGFELLMRGLTKHRSLRTLHVAGNALEGDAFESLTVAMDASALCAIEVLNLSDNHIGALETELLAQSLCQDTCPRLQTLLLSGNSIQGDGITRFLCIFHSRVARTLHTLDLSGNAIPSHLLDAIADELVQSHCEQLQVLNVSRNAPPRSVVRFQQLIRSNACPSLACVQVGYAQAEEQGYAFVRTTRSKMSVDELRRLKQRRFNERMEQQQREDAAKAARAAARCKRQTKLLRERYDHMESQADRALRRRKRVRKSPHLHIHEEIAHLKQAKYHEKVRRDLARALGGAVTA